MLQSRPGGTAENSPATVSTGPHPRAFFAWMGRGVRRAGMRNKCRVSKEKRFFLAPQASAERVEKTSTAETIKNRYFFRSLTSFLNSS